MEYVIKLLYFGSGFVYAVVLRSIIYRLDAFAQREESLFVLKHLKMWGIYMLAPALVISFVLAVQDILKHSEYDPPGLSDFLQPLNPSWWIPVMLKSFLWGCALLAVNFVAMYMKNIHVLEDFVQRWGLPM